MILVCVYIRLDVFHFFGTQLRSHSGKPWKAMQVFTEKREL